MSAAVAETLLRVQEGSLPPPVEENLKGFEGEEDEEESPETAAGFREKRFLGANCKSHVAGAPL